MEGSEEGLFDPQGFFKANGGDLAGGGMDPAMIVVVDFMIEHGLALTYMGDIIAHAGPDEVIL